MRKIFAIALSFVLSAVLLFQTLSPVSAATCGINPNTIAQNSSNVSIAIEAPGATDGEYNAHLLTTPVTFSLVKGKGSATFSNFPDQGTKTLVVKTKNGGTEICRASVVVTPPQGSNCKISITSQKLDPNTPVGFKVEGIASGEYGIKVDDSYKKSVNLPGNFDLDPLLAGTHKVSIYTCNLVSCHTLQCPEFSFGVGTHANPTNPTSTTGTTGGLDVPALLRAGCTKSDEINTAIGCIPVGNPGKTVTFFLGWAIGISGGIAFLLIVWSAIQMMTAQGDPQKLQAGREVLTAAISGLIFIIFSVFLLNLIGVKILQLPGF